MRATGLTDIGLVRKSNEDRLLIDEKIGLFIVCDGMGGHKGGDVASTLAIQVFKDSLAAFDRQEPVKWLTRCVIRANEVINSSSKENPELFEMGTTITAAILTELELLIAHVGDSRLYLINKTGIRKLTRDHTLAEQMLEDGLLKPEEMSNNAYNHVLTRALGIEEEIVTDHLAETVIPGDIILLCTDGLSDMLDEEEILSTINAFGPDIEGAAHKLVASALDNGGYDNITLILILV
ncbi:protein serine/threonine phosphatase prpc, regulation of stationary phase [hydrocarbon metagenome]|uniref:Protein serine/threonine phosphatase prpc, regulation of stationary phase n=1 Tax=hydrocarbon metagenome TaxID=938273 RepID=A0A0W8E5Y9_9ZZZZ